MSNFTANPQLLSISFWVLPIATALLWRSWGEMGEEVGGKARCIQCQQPPLSLHRGRLRETVRGE